MRTTDEPPASWGTTRIAELVVPGADTALELPSWYAFMLPGRNGLYHHGTHGSIAPDTLALAHAGAVIALADVVPLHPSNLYAHDSEYLLAIRLREVLDAAAWAGLPWAPFGAPTVIYAIDKFHGTEWPRLPEVACALSHGGGWDDLQLLTDEAAPPASAAPPWRDRTVPPSDGALLRAVARGDAARLRAMLAAGGNPLAGVDPPDVRNGLSLGASWPSHASLLVTAVLEGTVEVLEVVLAAGAPVDHRIGTGWTALHTAVANRRRDHALALLRHGADPRLVSDGRDAIELARQYAPDLVDRLSAP